MKTLLGTAALVVTVGLPQTLASQATPPGQPARDTVITAATDIMQAARYATLVTVDEDGQPQARIVDPFPPEADLTIWIGTKPVTRKVGQIRHDPRVTLLYFHAASYEYVTVLGTAEVVADSAEKARHWKEEWGTFYQDKNQGPDYVLIRVRPSRLEVVSPGHGLRNDAATWRPVLLDVR